MKSRRVRDVLSFPEFQILYHIIGDLRSKSLQSVVAPILLHKDENI